VRQVVRNALTAIAALASALIVGATLQKAFSLLWPALATRVVGVADVGTYVGYASVAVCFFICGFIAPRWIRSRFPLAWLLLPIAVVYAAAIIRTPRILECLPRWWSGCWLIHSLFIVPLVACACGYVALTLVRGIRSGSGQGR
jgi:hypothetical protein